MLHPVPAGDESRIDISKNVRFVPDFDNANVKQMLNEIQGDHKRRTLSKGVLFG